MTLRTAVAAGALTTGPANAAESAPQAIRPRSVTFTGLSLPAAQVTFGAEQGEKVTFTVSNLSGPAPLGTVSIVAVGNGSSAFLCSGTLTPLPGSLTFSAGSCGSGSSPLSPGSYDVGATYPGNTAQGNFASASQPQHLGVLPVTTTNLDLPDPQISVSQEQSERLTAGVLPGNGGVPAPSGSVTIRAGATIICTTPPVSTASPFAAPPRAATCRQPSAHSHFQRRCGRRRLHLRAAGTHGNPVTVTLATCTSPPSERKREP